MKFLEVTPQNSDTIILQAVYNLLYHDDAKFTRYTSIQSKIIRTDVRGFNSVKGMLTRRHIRVNVLTYISTCNGLVVYDRAG